ncbi:pentatricopeptide repeat-containing protein [Cocos nucifera]|uniref:Pentatricopeptide repeat-containing protein n=1 Tax=Cocos nucifera TaxID=13894 RepID=A0A8K0IFR5_COCNU|nr:pentatricopeptide repeat-containing protein [Cocos nucifera]
MATIRTAGPRGGELWSLEEKLCFSLLQRIPSPPPSSVASQLSSLLQIHAFLLRRGFDANLSLLTRLISSFSDLAAASARPFAAFRLLLHARRAFDRRPAQDTVLCNSMIRALVHHRRFRESIALYRDLRRGPPPTLSPPFSPDDHTFPFLLKSCASLAGSPKEPREGLQLHADVIKLGFCRSVFASTALVDVYSKSGDMTFARKVFDGMPQRSPASWTSMAVGYARSGDVGAAMEFFRWMPEKDTAAFNAMIDGFVKLGDLNSARQLFDEMQDRNVVSWTSLISGYCKVGDMELARFLFDEMPERNLYSWNVMIGGYCQNRQPHQSLELFRELLSESCQFEPDEVTLVSIIPAIADMGAIDLGRWIHSYARRKGLDRGISVSTALVHMYAKCGDIDEAKQIFDRMPSRETASWNAMINGFAVNGRAKEALDVFEEMHRRGISPNEVTMIGVLSACSHAGLVDEGRRWFREMAAFGIERRIEHYGCMVDLLGRGGYLEEAERMIKEMPCDPNGVVLSSLLFACGCHGDVARAERVMKMASEIEPGNVRNYIMLRNIYAGKKWWGEVEKITEVMRKFGGKREAGCSVIEVGSRVLEFVSGDRAHPEWEMICGVLGNLQLLMKGKERSKEFDMMATL